VGTELEVEGDREQPLWGLFGVQRQNEKAPSRSWQAWQRHRGTPRLMWQVERRDGKDPRADSVKQKSANAFTGMPRSMQLRLERCVSF